MRPQKIENEELIQGLLSVIRSKGYDGASIKDLEEATGLKKASLYHRFPDGKKEMAQKVMGFVASWMSENVISVLENSSISCEDRLNLAIQNIHHFYGGGTKTCLFRALSLDNSFELFQKDLQFGMTKWINSFVKLGIDRGFSVDKANRKAQECIVLIQGGLLVAKVMQDTTVFVNCLNRIKKIYK